MFEGDEDNSAAICPGLELGKVIKGSWRELNSQEKKLKRALVCSTMLLASGWKESRSKYKPLRHFQWKGKPFVLPAGWQRAVSTWWDHQLESREVNGQWQLLEWWMLFCSFRVLYQVDCWQQVSVSLVWIWTRSWLNTGQLFDGLLCMSLWPLHPSLAEKVFMLWKVFFPVWL